MNWSALWGHSVLDRFELMEERVPEEWFHYGVVAGHSSQYSLGQGRRGEHAPESLQTWVDTLREIGRVPLGGMPQKINPPWTRDLTPKKKHEIESLLSHFKTLIAPVEGVLDIGGGAGHLARHLARELRCPVESIDRDPVLQDKARRILEKPPWRHASMHSVRFKTGEFSDVEYPDPVDPGHWAVGLHTCGPLAWSHLKLVARGYSVLNVGCCYEKLNVHREIECSERARRSSLPWTEEALYLAERGGVYRTQEDFEFQQRMQGHRFSLHQLLLQQGVDPDRAQAVGSAGRAVYEDRFSSYVQDRRHHSSDLRRALSSLSDRACEDFFQQVGPRVEKMRFIAYLRNLLARPVELAILVDRAMFVEERMPLQDHGVRLIQFFDPVLSPRNVALVVRQ